MPYTALFKYILDPSLRMLRLTQELLMLIERESNFMMRGIMKNNMDALRNRIQTSFLQVIQI